MNAGHGPYQFQVRRVPRLGTHVIAPGAERLLVRRCRARKRDSTLSHRGFREACHEHNARIECGPADLHRQMGTQDSVVAQREAVSTREVAAQPRERLPAHAHQKPPQSPITGLAGGPFQGTLAAPCLHFMLVPDYTAGCPSCSASADGFNGIVVHLVNHDAMLWAVNRNRRDTWTGTTRETCSTTKDILE
jgi:Bacterial protein of unknown function (DUF899)